MIRVLIRTDDATMGPMKPFCMLVENETGHPYTMPEETIIKYWTDAIAAGTHRIVRIDGEQSAGWLPIESAPRDGRLILWGDAKGHYAIINWPTYKECFENPGSMWTEFTPIPQPNPAEPAQDSELVRELKALRHTAGNLYGYINHAKECENVFADPLSGIDEICTQIDAIISKHTGADA